MKEETTPTAGLQVEDRMKKEIYVALDLEEPVKDAIIGIYETYNKAEKGVEEYQSWKVNPSESIRIVSQELELS